MRELANVQFGSFVCQFLILKAKIPKEGHLYSKAPLYYAKILHTDRVNKLEKLQHHPFNSVIYARCFLYVYVGKVFCTI